MSERVIVEFYESVHDPKPLVSVLSLHGGEEPETAAYTIATFLAEMRRLKDARLDDAGTLSARFISWLGCEGTRSKAPWDFDDVSIIRDSSSFAYYLVAQIYVTPDGPRVKFVNDSLSVPEEFVLAEEIANQE